MPKIPEFSGRDRSLVKTLIKGTIFLELSLIKLTHICFTPFGQSGLTAKNFAPFSTNISGISVAISKNLFTYIFLMQTFF